MTCVVSFVCVFGVVLVVVCWCLLYWLAVCVMSLIVCWCFGLCCLRCLLFCGMICVVCVMLCSVLCGVCYL